MNKITKAFYSINDVCSLLNFSRVTICKLIKSGKIPAIKLQRSWRIPAAEFEKTVEKLIKKEN